MKPKDLMIAAAGILVLAMAAPMSHSEYRRSPVVTSLVCQPQIESVGISTGWFGGSMTEALKVAAAAFEQKATEQYGAAFADDNRANNKQLDCFRLFATRCVVAARPCG